MSKNNPLKDVADIANAVDPNSKPGAATAAATGRAIDTPPNQDPPEPMPNGQDDKLPASVDAHLKEKAGKAKAGHDPSIPSVSLEVAIEALRKYESNGERPTISKDNLTADTSTTIRPNPDGEGFVLVVIQGYNAHQLAHRANDTSDSDVRQAEARIDGIKKHLNQLKEDFETVKEDHARGLRTDHELAISKAAYDSNVAHVKAPMEADVAIVEAKKSTKHAAKPVENRIVIEAKTVAEFMKSIKVVD